MKTNTPENEKSQAKTSHPASAGRSSRHSERGASLVEMGLMTTFLMLLLIGVIDMGRAYYLGMEVQDAARAGAMYGYETSATMKDTTGISTAASNDAPEVSGLSTTSSYGCMCSNGSSPSTDCATPPTCSSGYRQVNYVIVNTSATYTTLFPWPRVPASFALTGTAKLIAGQ